MDERQLSDREVRNLKFLKTLVTALTATMIVGVLAIIILLVIRLQTPAPTLPALPANIDLPGNTMPEAVTFGRNWVAIVTDDDRILIFDSATGELRQDVQIDVDE